MLRTLPYPTSKPITKACGIPDRLQNDMNHISGMIGYPRNCSVSRNQVSSTPLAKS